MNSRGQPPGVFRGPELGRLLTLSLLLVVVAALILLSRRAPDAPQRPAARPAAELPPLPPPDAGPEFQGIQDRVPINARDTAAYGLLMDRLRATPPAELRSAARREIVYSQFFDEPERFRGLPIHVQGTARRVLSQDVGASSLVFPGGRYYEAYVFTPDGQNNPYVFVSEDVPPELPVGDEIAEPVRFDGYFLKLMAYLGGDGQYRAAPMLVGRYQPNPAAASRRAPGRQLPLAYLLLGGVALLLLLRLAVQFRRALFAPRGRTGFRSRTITDQIEPEDLSAWIAEEQRRDDEDPESDDPDWAASERR